MSHYVTLCVLCRCTCCFVVCNSGMRSLPRDTEESDTGLAPPSQWDLEGDKQMMKQDCHGDCHGLPTFSDCQDQPTVSRMRARSGTKWCQTTCQHAKCVELVDLASCVWSARCPDQNPHCVIKPMLVPSPPHSASRSRPCRWHESPRSSILELMIPSTAASIGQSWSKFIHFWMLLMLLDLFASRPKIKHIETERRSCWCLNTGWSSERIITITCKRISCWKRCARRVSPGHLTWLLILRTVSAFFQPIVHIFQSVAVLRCSQVCHQDSGVCEVCGRLGWEGVCNGHWREHAGRRRHLPWWEAA